MTEVRKIGAWVQISRADALDLGIVTPTEGELREAAASRHALVRRQRRATDAWLVFVRQLGAISNHVARAMLDLHTADEQGECLGCDFGGYEAERPIWPCRTVTTVAETFAIAVHPDLDLAEQYGQRTGA